MFRVALSLGRANWSDALPVAFHLSRSRGSRRFMSRRRLRRLPRRGRALTASLRLARPIPKARAAARRSLPSTTTARAYPRRPRRTASAGGTTFDRRDSVGASGSCEADWRRAEVVLAARYHSAPMTVDGLAAASKRPAAEDGEVWTLSGRKGQRSFEPTASNSRPSLSTCIEKAATG